MGIVQGLDSEEWKTLVPISGGEPSWSGLTRVGADDASPLPNRRVTRETQWETTAAKCAVRRGEHIRVGETWDWAVLLHDYGGSDFGGEMRHLLEVVSFAVIFPGTCEEAMLGL
jgi:hypothetical protein